MMFFSRISMRKYILLILGFLEIWLITWATDHSQPYIFPFLLLATGISMAIIYYRSTNNAGDIFPISNYLIALAAGIYLLVLILLFQPISGLFNANPLDMNDVTNSDVIPTIMHLQDRFFNGEQIYQEVHFKDYSLPVTYLPAMWMPYAIAKYFQFDFRWIPIIAIFIAFCMYLFSICKKYIHFKGNLIPLSVMLFPLVTWTAFFLQKRNLITQTVESLPTAYYLLAGIFIIRKNWLWVGVFLGLCILSRFSIILFVPLIFFILFIKERRNFILFSIGFFTIILGLYIFPYLMKDPGIFLQGYRYYTQAAIGEWNHTLEFNTYWHLGNGLGFTKIAMDAWKGLSAEQMVAKYQMLQKIFIIATVIFMSIYYWIKRKSVDSKKFILAGIKINLAVFYALVQVPYQYLFLLPVMFSSVLIFDFYLTVRSKKISEVINSVAE